MPLASAMPRVRGQKAKVSVTSSSTSGLFFFMKTPENSILLLSLRFHLKGKPILYVLGVV